MPPTRPIPPPPSSPKEFLATILARWVGIWWYFCTWWTGSTVAKIRSNSGPNPGLWVSQRKVRRGGRTKKKNTHTQPTQKQEEKLFKCLKTFAKPANFAHAHICTATRAPFHTETVGWQYLQSKVSRHCRPSGRHAWCDFYLICDLNLNCDLSGAHSIWICDADP
jgi:hypothetical protein